MSLKSITSAEELIKEQDNAQRRVCNIQAELHERGEVKHEFHSLVMCSVYAEITPRIASKILTSYNGGKGGEATNRSMSKVKAAQIERDMKSGNFLGYVSMIIFDDEGVLMDGQTRLQALLDSKLPQHMHVIMGVPREGMIKVDIGRKRTNADRFRLAGMLGKCTNSQASWYERLARFSCAAGMPNGKPRNPFSRMKSYIPDDEIEMEVKRLKEPIMYIVENLADNKALRKLPSLVAIAQWWVEYDNCGCSQEEEAKRFYHELITGTRVTGMWQKGDPIFTLREQLLKIDWQKQGHNLVEQYRLAYGWTMHSINKHLHYQKLTRLTKRSLSYNLVLHSDVPFD